MLVILVVLVSAIWVLVDAKNIGVKKGLVSGLGDMGPIGWFLVTLLLWIIGFPMYLYYRGSFKSAIAAQSNSNLSEQQSSSVQKNNSQSLPYEELEKLASLKEKGFITEIEFEAKKKQLLGV